MREALKVVSLSMAIAGAALGPAIAQGSGRAGRGSPPGGDVCSPQRSARRSPGEPLHIRVARAVFPRERWQKLMHDSSEALAQSIAEQGKGHIKLAPQFTDRLREQYERMLPYEEMMSDQASELGRHYNRVELVHMLRFYTSPVGKKTVMTLPTLMTVTMSQAQDRVKSRLPEALERLKPYFEVVPPGGDEEAQRDRPEGTGMGPGEAGSTRLDL
jgi:hypothetical protein